MRKILPIVLTLLFLIAFSYSAKEKEDPLVIKVETAKLTPMKKEALAWLDTSKLEDNLWARFYAPGTNVPIYGDRDGLIHYTLEEISEERRRGYSWQGSYGVRDNIGYYEAVRGAGVNAYNLSLDVEPSRQELESRLQSQTGPAQRAVDTLDSHGRWVNADGWLYSGDFVENFGALVDYLETYDALQ